MGHDRNQSRSQERSKLNDHPHDQNQPRRPRNNHLPNGITSECERRSSRSKPIVLRRNKPPPKSKDLLVPISILVSLILLRYFFVCLCSICDLNLYNHLPMAGISTSLSSLKLGTDKIRLNTWNPHGLCQEFPSSPSGYKIF